MITVSILINGEPLITRSAMRRTGKVNCTYEMDDGNIIHHKPEDGALKLAIKMLKKVKELKKE